MWIDLFPFSTCLMISLLSINANGWRDPVKRAAFIRWIHFSNLDICCVRESHTASDAELTSWFSASCYTTFGSHGSVKSAGVIVLFKRHYSLVTSARDDSGRLAVCTFDLNGRIFQVVSLYAPNRNPDRNSFLNSATDPLDLSLPTLLTGDFNSVLDPLLDHRGGSPSPQRESCAALSNLFSTSGCVDAWRSSHPNLHSYTWLNHDGSMASRIDTIACPADWFPSVSSCIHVPCPFSDHCAVSCSLSIPDSMPHGPGFWKLNTSIINDPSYVECISSFLASWRTKKSSFRSLLNWWDEGKSHIKRLSIQFCSRKSAADRRERLRLESFAFDLKDLIDGGQTSLLSDYRDCLDHLLNLDKTEAKGAQIRARAKWVEEGETSSAYFCRLEKKRNKESRFSAVRRDDNTFATSLPDIIDTWRSFYVDLFTSSYTDPAVGLDMLSRLESTLSSDESESCEGPISIEEARKAAAGMAHNKSPGIDGLPVEFYLAFWNCLGPDFVEVINFAHDAGYLSLSQRRGLVSLIFKKGDRYSTKNWRPITLLCADYKIAARAIAGRFCNVIGSVVSADQTCGVPGRFIGENVALLRDVVSLASEQNLPVAILSLDQEKAFDRVEWSFLFDTLFITGFGPDFISWIRLFYSLPQSSVLVNGYQSQFFSPTRGVQQGCPLSPLLYVLTAEVLACSIRADPRIVGLALPSVSSPSALLSQYADDTSVIVTSDDSIHAVFEVYSMYELASGARVNKEKSKGLWLGSWSNRTDTPENMESRNLKTLGVHIDPGDLTEDNWSPRIEAVANTLDGWRQRALSYQGRALIINILALSRIWYVASLIPTPAWAITKLNTLIFSFFWKGKRDLVRRDIVCLPKSFAGFGMVNIKLKLASLHVMWIKRFFSSSHPWRLFLLHWFPGVSSFLRNPTNLPEFYRLVLSSWLSLKGGFSPSLGCLSHFRAFDSVTNFFVNNISCAL